MLTPYRRHRADCKHRSRRYKGCSCPIWIQGVLDGAPVRRSLDLTNWEAAHRRIQELEIHGDGNVFTVSEAAERFLKDREAMQLGTAMMSKYKNVVAELKEKFGNTSLRAITPDDVRKLRESWKLAPITLQKRLEMVRKFFAFCVDSDWIPKNPAKSVKAPVVKHVPTLPFSDEEMEKIIWACESIREAHPKMPADAPKKLKALVLLMRHSGVRISDAVMFKDSLLKYGKLFLYQAKTGEPVWVPLPKNALEAIADCREEGREYYFYLQIGTVKTAITDWQWRLRKVYDMAGLPDGHSHRLRDTFAVALLEKGVPIETVSTLLGHTSIKTTEKHYAPWVKKRQTALEDAVKLSWAS